MGNRITACRKVLCFGDSNTYGFDPRSYFGSRYGAEGRWVDLLAAQTGWEIRNEGMNGREIPRQGITLPEDTDLLIIMLGTNDLLQGRGPQQTAERMAAFLSGLSIPCSKVFLIAPPPMEPGERVSGPELIRESRQLAEEYRSLSGRLGIQFADAGEWGVSIAFDGVHFTEEGHRAFAAGLISALQET